MSLSRLPEVLKIIDTTDLYHAYFIENSHEVFQELYEYLKERIQNPEIHLREFDFLGVDDSREFARIANMRSVGTQLFIYRVGSFSIEAQNALLKLFEEPPDRTHFFIFINSVSDILPTLRSRVRIISIPGKKIEEEEFINKFINSSIADRILMLDLIIKDRNIALADNLLNGIEMNFNKYKSNNTKYIFEKYLISVRKVLHDKGAPLKVLLESMAILTPKF